jgi:hypothetical protein
VVEREIGGDPLAPPPAQRRGETGVADQREHRPRHPVDVVLVHEEAGLAVDHHVRDAGVARADHGDAGRAGLEHRHRRALDVPVAGRDRVEDDRADAPHGRRDLRVRPGAEELDGAIEAQRARQLPARLQQRPVADHREPGVRARREHLAERHDREVRRLLVHEPVHRQEVRRRRGGVRRREQRGVGAARVVRQAVARRAEGGQGLLGLARDDHQAGHRAEHAPVRLAVDAPPLPPDGVAAVEVDHQRHAGVRARLPDLRAGLAELGEHDVDPLPPEPPRERAPLDRPAARGERLLADEREGARRRRQERAVVLRELGKVPAVQHLHLGREAADVRLHERLGVG